VGLGAFLAYPPDGLGFVDAALGLLSHHIPPPAGPAAVAAAGPAMRAAAGSYSKGGGAFVGDAAEKAARVWPAASAAAERHLGALTAALLAFDAAAATATAVGGRDVRVRALAAIDAAVLGSPGPDVDVRLAPRIPAAQLLRSLPLGYAEEAPAAPTRATQGAAPKGLLPLLAVTLALVAAASVFLLVRCGLLCEPSCKRRKAR